MFGYIEMKNLEIGVYKKQTDWEWLRRQNAFYVNFSLLTHSCTLLKLD